MGTAWGHVLFGLPISWFVQVIIFLLGNTRLPQTALIAESTTDTYRTLFKKIWLAFFVGDGRVEELLIVHHVLIRVLQFHHLMGNAYATN